MKKSILTGLFGTIALLSLYFGILTLISGWSYTLKQFLNFWYYILTLALGFDLQIGLYTYLKTIVHNSNNGKVVAVSGTTSTFAMLSCCSHYLVNLLPVLGVTGLVTIISQYQIQLFWFGIMANLIGIAYIGKRVIKVSKKNL